MTAKLLIREVGQREFVNHNGNYENDADLTAPNSQTGEQIATAEGERLCASGNVEAFEVWSRVSSKQRVYKIEDIPS